MQNILLAATLIGGAGLIILLSFPNNGCAC